jgi:hypothetical protein
MAEVTVFVDDVVIGRLPPVCIKEGIPTADHLTVRDASSGPGFGAAWLLVILGPIGWIVLLYLSLAGKGGLTGRLPFSEFAYRRLKVAQRMQTVWIVAAIVVGLLASLSLAIFSSTRSAASSAALIALGAATVGALVMLALQTREVRRAEVHLVLDDSHRWVTIKGVHPDFAAALAHSATEPSGVTTGDATT